MTERKAPREFWIEERAYGTYQCWDRKQDGMIHAREVLPDEPSIEDLKIKNNHLTYRLDKTNEDHVREYVDMRNKRDKWKSIAEELAEALNYYAKGQHFKLFDGDTMEDGAIAREAFAKYEEMKK